jgi:hypothetical protein
MYISEQRRQFSYVRQSVVTWTLGSLRIDLPACHFGIEPVSPVSPCIWPRRINFSRGDRVPESPAETYLCGLRGSFFANPGRKSLKYGAYLEGQKT